MRKVWAMVRLTIAESIRTRLAVAFILLLIAVMVLLISTASGDGTIRGKIQMFLSYSISLTHFLLALLVTFLACKTLDQDIKTQRIDSLACKPLARWQLLLGRWLGILILTIFLFSLSMGITYGMIRWYAGNAPDKSKDQFEIQNQVLVARREYQPPLPDVSSQVEKRYEQLKAEGGLPEGRSPSEIRKIIADELIRQSRTVTSRQMIEWKIHNLPQPKEGEVVLTLRYKYEVAGNLTMDEQAQLRSDTFLGQWVVGKRDSKKAYMTPPIAKSTRTVHELFIPLNAVEPDGTLTISFFNIDPRNVTVHFPLQDGIEVLVREGTFAPNFIRTLLIALATLVFLVTLALTCGTFLSFPIASLLTLSVFFVGIAGNFLNEAIGMAYGLQFTDNMLDNITKVVTVISLQVVPVLDISSFTSRLIDGKIVEWKDALLYIGSLAVVKTGILAIFGVFVFHRRELGKVTI